MVVGPTAVGKTALSIELAAFFETVVLSADSRQFYREMEIGTAKPSREQLTAVPHYFVNNLSVSDFYSVGDFERDVLAFLKEYFKSHSIAFLVGGSGLYIDAVVKGLDEMPSVPEELRQQIMQDVEASGLEPLLQELESLDPAYFFSVDKSNTQRVVRAIEVIRHTGLPFSSFWGKGSGERPFDVIKIGISADREVLYDTINQRVEEMMAQGLLEEAQRLYSQKDLYALQTVGYQEFFDFLDGRHSLEDAVALVKRNTRRFAKRQLTWFRRDLGIVWFANTELQKIKDYLLKQVALRG